MATHKLLLLPGDGIGPEVMAEVKRLIDWLNAQGIAHFSTEQGLVGGSAYDASQQSITDATMAMAMAASAAASTITNNAVIWPSMVPAAYREKAIRLMLAALSTNSTPMRIPTAFRLMVMVKMPQQNTNAASTR